MAIASPFLWSTISLGVGLKGSPSLTRQFHHDLPLILKQLRLRLERSQDRPLSINVYIPFSNHLSGHVAIQSILDVLDEHSQRWRTFVWREELGAFLMGDNPFSMLISYNPTIRFDQLEHLEIETDQHWHGLEVDGRDWPVDFPKRFPKLRSATFPRSFPGLKFLP